MEFNKSVSNPMLMGAIELMKAEDTPEHRNMFIGELGKASFLSPAIVDPAPTEGEAPADRKDFLWRVWIFLKLQATERKYYTPFLVQKVFPFADTGLLHLF